jgi:hypothetical protein
MIQVSVRRPPGCRQPGTVAGAPKDRPRRSCIRSPGWTQSRPEQVETRPRSTGTGIRATRVERRFLQPDGQTRNGRESRGAAILERGGRSSVKRWFPSRPSCDDDQSDRHRGETTQISILNSPSAVSTIECHCFQHPGKIERNLRSPTMASVRGNGHPRLRLPKPNWYYFCDQRPGRRSTPLHRHRTMSAGPGSASTFKRGDQ